jgi:uncharacterized cupredoxin-like copper-binding protein
MDLDLKPPRSAGGRRPKVRAGRVGVMISVGVMLSAVAILLAGCVGAASEPGTAQSPRVVDLTMTDEMTFAPDRIEVRAGETILFRVRNASDQAHEAYIGTEAEQRLHELDHSGFGPDDQGSTSHMGYGVHVAPFGTGELTSQFDADTEYVVGCHYPGHYDAGMRAVVDVTD